MFFSFIKPFCVVCLLLFAACVMKPSSESLKGSLKDLNLAIERIEERSEAQEKLLKEQKAIKYLLVSNMDSVHTDGMRSKLRKEIAMKDIIIQRAQNHLENQKLVLKNLYIKKDSIQKNAVGKRGFAQ